MLTAGLEPKHPLRPRHHVGVLQLRPWRPRPERDSRLFPETPVHPLLQLAVDQAQVECQVGIHEEKGHDHGVSNAHAPDPLVPDQEDQVIYHTMHPAPRATMPLDWTVQVWRIPYRNGKQGIPEK